MGHLKIKIKIILTLIIFLVTLSCGIGSKLDPVVSEALQTPQGDQSLKNIPTSWWPMLDNGSTPTEISLKQNNNRPTIIMFSKYQCSSCIKEHQLLRDSLASFSPVSNYRQHINIYTFIVDGNFSSPEGISTAKTWKDRYLLPWPLGVDSNQTLFKLFCNKNQTPCTVIFNPQNSNVYSHIGSVPLADLERYSGVSWTAPTPIATPTEDDVNQAGTLLGTMLSGSGESTIDGGATFTNVDLTQNNHKKTVLLISTIGCVGCIEEHNTIREQLNWQDYNFYTLLLEVPSSDTEGILLWWNDTHHPWPLLTEPLAFQFFDLVPEGIDRSTPTAFIFDEENRLIYLHVGVVPLTTLKSYLEN